MTLNKFGFFLNGDPRDQDLLHSGTWSSEDVLRFENEYRYKEKIVCMVPGCGTPHNHGYTARLRSGSRVLVGNDCGADFLKGSQFAILTNEFNNRRRFERIQDLLQSASFNPEAAFEELKTWHHEASLNSRAHSALRNYLDTGFIALESACSKDSGRLFVERRVADYARVEAVAQTTAEGQSEKLRTRVERVLFHTVAGHSFVCEGALLLRKVSAAQTGCAEIISLCNKRRPNTADIIRIQDIARQTQSSIQFAHRVLNGAINFWTQQNFEKMAAWFRASSSRHFEVRVKPDGTWSICFGRDREISPPSVKVPSISTIHHISLSSGEKRSA